MNQKQNGNRKNFSNAHVRSERNNNQNRNNGNHRQNNRPRGPPKRPPAKKQPTREEMMIEKWGEVKNFIPLPKKSVFQLPEAQARDFYEKTYECFANFLLLKGTESLTFFKYDLVYSPQIKKEDRAKLHVKLMLLSDQGQVFLPSGEMLYTTKKLTPTEKTKLPYRISTDKDKFWIEQIKDTKIQTINAKNNVEDYETALGLALVQPFSTNEEKFEVLGSRIFLKNRFEIVNKAFSDAAPGMKLYWGLRPMIKKIEGGKYAANIDVSAAVFFDEQPLEKYCEALCSARKKSLEKILTGADTDYEWLEAKIKGLKVYYAGFNPKTKQKTTTLETIVGFHEQQQRGVFPISIKQGKKYAFVKDLTIKHQKYEPKVNSKITSAVIKACAVKCLKRQGDTMNFIQQVGIKNHSTFGKMKVKVSENFLNAVAKKLHDPEIKMKDQKGEEIKRRVENGVWDYDGANFMLPTKPIKNKLKVALFWKNDYRKRPLLHFNTDVQSDVLDFYDILVKAGKSRGVSFNEKISMFICGGSLGSVKIGPGKTPWARRKEVEQDPKQSPESAFKADLRIFEELKKEKFDLVLCVLEDGPLNFHGDITTIADIKVGIPTMCLKQSSVALSQPPKKSEHQRAQIILELIGKLNSKLGGTNHEVMNINLPKNAIHIGSDVSHGETDEKTSFSTVGFVGAS